MEYLEKVMRHTEYPRKRFEQVLTNAGDVQDR